MENKGQYALITGGTSGIGYEPAALLAQDGYNLILVAPSSREVYPSQDQWYSVMSSWT